LETFGDSSCELGKAHGSEESINAKADTSGLLFDGATATVICVFGP
jgi:hypothetical protein